MSNSEFLGPPKPPSRPSFSSTRHQISLDSFSDIPEPVDVERALLEELEEPIRSLVAKYLAVITQEQESMTATNRREINFPLDGRGPKRMIINMMLGWGIAWRESQQPPVPIGFGTSAAGLSHQIIEARRNAALISSQAALKGFYDYVQDESEECLRLGHEVQQDLLKLPPDIRPGKVKDSLEKILGMGKRIRLI